MKIWAPVKMSARPRVTLTPQRGVVLFTALVLMLLVTLLATSILKTAVLEMKLSGAGVRADENYNRATNALTQTQQLNDGNFAPGFQPALPSVTGIVVTAQEVSCTQDAATGSGMNLGASALDAVYFDIDAQLAANGDASNVHQGIKSVLPPGACL